MILISVQVCAGAKVLRDWGILSVNGECIISEVFQGLCTGKIESTEGFRLPDEYANSPFSCSVAHSQLGRFQSISLMIKVVDAVEFGKYFKFLLQVQCSMQSARKNAFTVLMEEAGKLVWPDKVEISRKNNKQKLYNDVIDLLQQNGLGWMKQNVLSEGRPFILQLVDILWQLDGHHEKLAAQSCAVPDIFASFQNYNVPESYKRKRPNLKCEMVATMAQTLFNILQQVSNVSSGNQLDLWIVFHRDGYQS